MANAFDQSKLRRRALTNSGSAYVDPADAPTPDAQPLPSDASPLAGGTPDPVIDPGVPDAGMPGPDAYYDPNPFGIEPVKPKVPPDDPSGGLFPDGPLYPQDDALLPPTGPTTPTTPVTPTTPTADGGLDAAVRAALLGLLQRSPVSGADVANSPAAQAYKLSQQRGREQQQADLAERAAQSGLSGGLEGPSRGLDFANAEATNQYIGGLAQTQEESRLNSLLSALGLAQNSLNFNKQLGFDYSQLESDANYRALLALLGGVA